MEEEIKQDPTDDQSQASPQEEESLPESYEIDSDDAGEEATPPDKTPEKEDDSQAKSKDQEAVEKRISELTWKRKEEERKREQAEKELAAMRERMEKEEQNVSVPPVPDAYDPDYDQKIRQRDEALKKQAAIEYQKQSAEQQRIENDRKATQTAVKKMYSDAEQHGISERELNEADNRVSMFIKSPDLAKYLINHPKAPLVVKHLANNIDDLEKISSMSAVDAAAYIASEVAPRAAKLKPRITKAPDPMDIPSGKGAGEKVNRFMEGVVME